MFVFGGITWIRSGWIGMPSFATTAGIRTDRARISARRLSFAGSMCWITTKAIPVTAGNP